MGQSDTTSCKPGTDHNLTPQSESQHIVVNTQFSLKEVFKKIVNENIGSVT